MWASFLQELNWEKAALSCGNNAQAVAGRSGLKSAFNTEHWYLTDIPLTSIAV